MKTKEKLIVDGKRIDGRLVDQLRPIEMKLDIVDRANGSSSVRFGDTHAIASVFGPRNLFPRYLQESDTGIVRCRYNMTPFSVDERKNPGPSRRSVEISKVVKFALEPAVFLEDFPKTTVDTFIEVLEADGSTRVTGINALSLALADSGVPMKDLIAACSVGKVDGQLVVDLNGLEDNNCESDIAFAMMPSKDKITLLQMDGNLTKEELMNALDLARTFCKQIYKIQKKTLKEKYRGV